MQVGLRKAVREFHDAIEDDAELAPVFAKVDHRSQSAEQAHFLELAMTDDTEAESARPRPPLAVGSFLANRIHY